MGVCDDIQRIVAKFWWGSKREGRNIHWAKWEKMSQAKCNGGMGFRDFSSFNQALLAKQGWRIQQCPDSLVARVLQAKLRVSNGQKIQIHKTNWIPKPLTFKPTVKPTLPSDTMVFELINEANCWDEKMIH
ncbi:hypothetical protein AB3S75_047448 [Citrus x aurantiifolia]